MFIESPGESQFEFKSPAKSESAERQKSSDVVVIVGEARQLEINHGQRQ